MQIYDGNLLHILKPMTRETRGDGEGWPSKARATTSLLSPRAKSREIEADYRVRSRYIDLHPTFDRFSRRNRIPMIGVRTEGGGGREKEARRKAERRIRRSEANE